MSEKKAKEARRAEAEAEATAGAAEPKQLAQITITFMDNGQIFYNGLPSDPVVTLNMFHTATAELSKNYLKMAVEGKLQRAEQPEQSRIIMPFGRPGQGGAA